MTEQDKQRVFDQYRKLEHALRIARDTLRKIASEDFRGNRPQSAVDSFNALNKIEEILNEKN